MRLKDIMTPEVETISEDEFAVQANERMWRRQMHHLVVMKNEELVGVLSDRDLGGDKATDIPDQLKVRDVMTRSTVTASPDTTVKDARNLMRGNHIHCLPIMDNQRLVGIVTESDLETLEKRGTAQPPFQGAQTQDPYVPLEKRNQRGSKSKYGHSEWRPQDSHHTL